LLTDHSRWPQISAINDTPFKKERFAGNAFILRYDGELYAVTAKHVLLLAKDKQVLTTDLPSELIAKWSMHPNGRANAALKLRRLLNGDASEPIDDQVVERDWLFFEIAENHSNLKPLNIRKNRLSAGETLYVVGCTYSDQATCKQDVFPGKFVSYSGSNLLVDMATNKQVPKLGGLSGGPVVDTNGDVVGIVSNVRPNPDGSGVLFAPADITQAVASLRQN
jgi:hypothetical protein